MRYNSWNTEWDRQFFVILKKQKKHLEMSSFYTCVPKITIIWCMLPEIWNTTIFLSFWAIFCPFTPLATPKIKIWNKKNPWRYYPITHVHHKSRSYDVWFLRYKAPQTVILGHFLPFDTTNNLKHQSYEKIKKTPEDITILHLIIWSYDVWFLRYRAWQTEFFVILDYF